MLTCTQRWTYLFSLQCICFICFSIAVDSSLIIKGLSVGHWQRQPYSHQQLDSPSWLKFWFSWGICCFSVFDPPFSYSEAQLHLLGAVNSRSLAQGSLGGGDMQWLLSPPKTFSWSGDSNQQPSSPIIFTASWVCEEQKKNVFFFSSIDRKDEDVLVEKH